MCARINGKSRIQSRVAHVLVDVLHVHAVRILYYMYLNYLGVGGWSPEWARCTWEFAC